MSIKIIYSERVESLITKKIDDKIKVVGVRTNKSTYNAEKVILATGGKSYPLTGSTGDGYEIARKVGHKIEKIRPSLVPLTTYETNWHKSIQGLSLKNVKIKVIDTEKSKVIYEDFGEMLFTHFGISGPIVLSASSHLVRYKNIENLLNDKK